MKFKIINNKKLLIILLSSFVITNISGCKSNDTTSPTVAYQTNNPTKQSIETKENETATKPEQTETTTEETITETSIEYSNDDLAVINEFEKLNEQTNTLDNNENTLAKAKAIFITAIDFIFYDSEINGVKFDDLTDDGKQKVLEIVTNIDTKIEGKFPNYKETISTKTKDAFNKASELIKTGANNINEFAKDKLGEENYNSLIEAKDELVNYTKDAADVIANFSSDLYKDGKQKIKNWYEEFKNN